MSFSGPQGSRRLWRRRITRCFVLLFVSIGCCTVGVAADAELLIPPVKQALHFAVRVPASFHCDPGQQCQLVERDHPDNAVPVRCVPAVGADGTLEKGAWMLAGTLPASSTARRFRLIRAQTPVVLRSGAGGFRFGDVDEKSLGLWEGDRPVFVYRYGMISQPGVPANRARSTYLHPIYGLEGEVLTDDFPKDHYHHRGLFWAWPHVRVGESEYSLWDLRGIRQQFERWLAREANSGCATLGVENGWFVGDVKVAQERVWLRTYAAEKDEQMVDVALAWIPVREPLSLGGAEGKSYGGLTLRFAPRTGTVITTPAGDGAEDLYMKPLAWADLSAQFAGAREPSGIAILISTDHPDYPPTWLTRHYGVLCVGWPGVEGKSFAPGKPIQCRYRLCIHRGRPGLEALQAAYDDYTALGKISWGIPAR